MLDKERRDRERQEAQAVALAQPHRRGSDHPWRESALGRLCLAYRLSDEVYAACLAWGNIVRDWRIAVGCPMDIHLPGKGTGNGASPETVALWEIEIEKVEHKLSNISKLHCWAARHVVIDDADLPEGYMPLGRSALVALAEIRGIKLDKRRFA